MTTQSLLTVRGLETGFGANQILHGVDLTLEPGRAAVLLGLNGAGKSVTLKTISGLQPAWAGSVDFGGRELVGLDPEDRIRAGLGHVLQAKSVFPDLSVAENLRLGGAILRDKRRFADNLARVHDIYPLLADRRSQLAGSMSGGERAMLAVARALMADPRLLLVDEPSAGLSPKMVEQLGGTLRRVREGGTGLLMVEQNVGFGLELADDVFVLEKGRVVYRDTADNLDRPRVASLLGIGDLLGANASSAPRTRTARRAPTRRRGVPVRAKRGKATA
ncbi:MAG: ABC transporter ATP-binding protein [Actinobacteria bacterium]|nr:ABC transporter ATP-binding protein [Actinomycetota bacterium]MBV9933085.1 ABC transporter ATP-binding protein [Actinomycetota bacterium]